MLYRGFESEAAFRLEIDQHLTAFAEGKVGAIIGSGTVPVIPDAIRAELEKQREATQRALMELEQLRAQAERAMQEAAQARAEAKDSVANPRTPQR